MLQVEALAQLGGIAMIDPKDKNQQNNFFFGGVDGVKWRRPVVPGDVLVRHSPLDPAPSGALAAARLGRMLPPPADR